MVLRMLHVMQGLRVYGMVLYGRGHPACKAYEQPEGNNMHNRSTVQADVSSVEIQICTSLLRLAMNEKDRVVNYIMASGLDYEMPPCCRPYRPCLRQLVVIAVVRYQVFQPGIQSGK